MLKLLLIYALCLLLFSALYACSSGDTLRAAASPTQEVNALSIAASEEPSPEPTDNREYTNIFFDYSDEIASINAKSESFTVPAVTDIGISVTDEKGATGVVIVPGRDSENNTDYYLNALVAGNKLTFSGDIMSAASRVGETVTHIPVHNRQFIITPVPISASKPIDEIIEITKTDGTVYSIHTINEFLPTMNITIGEEKPLSGVYSFTVDKCMIRVDTEGNIVYYRNMGHLKENGLENFKPQDAEDGRYYTYSLELNPDRRGMGITNGMYVVMDKDYKEIDYVTLAANNDKNHTHGEGYLDEHEFLLLSSDHWISLSYTPLFVNNLESGGIDGGNTAYVQACIIQEVQSGKVVREYNTVDYPELYAAAKENTRYEASSGTKTPNDFLDYAHANSIFIDPKDGNLIVSMRSQYAVYKFDRETGDIIWALGGALNDFEGLEDFYDANGNLFIGQHYARYVSEDIAGNDSTVTVFDNHTNYGGNTTRILTFNLDEDGKTASATAINGIDLDNLSDKKHWSTHCASFEMETKDTCCIGWGSNIILNGRPETLVTHALLTDYNISKNVITFELSVGRNSHYETNSDFCFSYRVYKNTY